MDRRTGDLDFFGLQSAEVDALAPALEAACRAAGLAVSRLREGPGFVRLEVTRADQRCEVDIGFDARLWPVTWTRLGPVIADQELAADKTLALFGRAEARDYVDVQALAESFGEDSLLQLAAHKDRGFSTAHLAEALDKFDRISRDRFDLDEPAYRALRTWARGWSEDIRSRAAEIGQMLQQGLDPGRDIGP